MGAAVRRVCSVGSGFGTVILEVSVWLSLNTRQPSTAHKTFNNIIMYNARVND